MKFAGEQSIEDPRAGLRHEPNRRYGSEPARYGTPRSRSQRSPASIICNRFWENGPRHMQRDCRLRHGIAGLIPTASSHAAASANASLVDVAFDQRAFDVVLRGGVHTWSIIAKDHRGFAQVDHNGKAELGVNRPGVYSSVLE